MIPPFSPVDAGGGSSTSIPGKAVGGPSLSGRRVATCFLPYQGLVIEAGVGGAFTWTGRVCAVPELGAKRLIALRVRNLPDISLALLRLLCGRGMYVCPGICVGLTASRRVVTWRHVKQTRTIEGLERYQTRTIEGSKLCQANSPALCRASALYKPHYRGPPTVLL